MQAPGYMDGMGMHTGLESVRFGAGGWVSLLDDKVMMKDEL